MRKSLLLISTTFILLAFFTSCKKNVEDRIDGMWRRVNVVNTAADQFEDWSFDNGYIYILRTKAGNPTYDTLGYGDYTIKANPIRKKLCINHFSDSYMIDKWTIQKLTAKVLVLYRQDPGEEYREFTKK
jgi:hypothetical protein